MNKSAQQILSRQDDLLLDRQGKLRLTNFAAATRLQEMIHSASQRQDGLKHDSGGVIANRTTFRLTVVFPADRATQSGAFATQLPTGRRPYFHHRPRSTG